MLATTDQAYYTPPGDAFCHFLFEISFFSLLSGWLYPGVVLSTVDIPAYRPSHFLLRVMYIMYYTNRNGIERIISLASKTSTLWMDGVISTSFGRLGLVWIWTDIEPCCI